MLKHRIITAVCLIAFLLFALLSFSKGMLFFLSLVGLAWAAYEWAGLSQVETIRQRILYCALMLLLAGGLVACSCTLVFWVGLVWWLMAFGLILFYPRKTCRNNIFRLSMGGFFLLPAWYAIIFLYTHNVAFLLYGMALVWAADSSAYFSGKRWGRRMLAPHVSPGKTWEGFLGALIVTPILAAGVGVWLDISFLSSLLMGVLVVPVSILGDLTESLFKRMSSLKDSGCLLPGHGGLLDRIDGLLPWLPILALLFMDGMMR